jgi:hypothetical protein
MVTVGNDVTCPLCGGECYEDCNCRTEYVWYSCQTCGYTTNSTVADSLAEFEKECPKKMRPFVKWATFGKDSGAVYTGRMPWWPSGVEALTSHSIYPVIISGEIKWRRQNIEEIPETERHNYPMKDGAGYYEYRDAVVYADYNTFKEAESVTSEQNQSNGLMQTQNKHPVKFTLLSRKVRQQGGN